MPPALDRLLASPPALRLLRAIVYSPEQPALCSHAHRCSRSTRSQRQYSSDAKHSGKPRWRRWNETAQGIVKRDKVRQFLEDDNEQATIFGKNVKDASTKPDTSEAPSIEDETARWAQDLARRERLHGKAGIAASWASRTSLKFDLPTEDTPHADFLWGTYVKNRTIVTEVIGYAAELLEERGHVYPRLYELVVGYWLQRHPMVALEYHRLMLDKLKIKHFPLQALAHMCRAAARPDAYAALMVVYRCSEEKKLYDQIIPPLMQLGEIPLARRWHKLCTSCHDSPSESVASDPILKILDSEHGVLGIEASVDSKRAQREARKYNRELLRRLSGRDTAPVRFEDSFCARMFATRTFPPESVIKGLAMVGVNEIGPQAILAMASRTEPLEDLHSNFESLRENGITLQGCVFSLALEKFAAQGDWQLVRSMIESDQHPDVFGDVEVQRKLLSFYMEQNDQLQTRRTLAILTLFHSDSTQESWNLLLQMYIKSSGPEHVQEVIADMRSRRITITPESITALRGMLRRRQLGRRPGKQTTNSFDDLRFVTRTFTAILESGLGAVSPLYWREILRRFGMMGRIRELRRLLVWLLCWYAPRGPAQFSALPQSPFLKAANERLRASNLESNHYYHFPSTIPQHANKLHPVRQLFPPQLLQAIIIWGFKVGLLQHASHEQSLYGPRLGKKHHRHNLVHRGLLQRQQWLVGLETVVQLRDLGVHVNQNDVIKALQAQFIVLFGRGRSRKKENRLMEQVNTIPYATYVREANRIWGSPLFVEPELFSKGVLHTHAWHPRMRRVKNRPRSISIKNLLR